MAKRKAELEDDAQRYRACVAEMREAHEQLDFEGALGFASAAWEFVDGMIQYERRFEKREERRSLECVEYALQYAPLIFHVQTLNILSELLRSQKRIDKRTIVDLSSKVDEAHTLLNDAHRLWDHIERNVQVEQNKLRRDLGGDQDRWRWLAERWEKLGLLRRIPVHASYVVSLTTRVEDEVRARCPSCGVIAKAAKIRFWEEITCPKCRAKVLFAILVPGES